MDMSLMLLKNDLHQRQINWEKLCCLLARQPGEQQKGPQRKLPSTPSPWGLTQACAKSPQLCQPTEETEAERVFAWELHWREQTPGAGVLSIWTLKHPHFLPWDWNAISNLMSFVLWPNSDIGRPQKSLVPILSHDLPHTLDPSTLTFHGAVPFRWGLICGVPTQQVPSPLLKAGGHWACWKRRLSVAFRGKVKGLRHTVGAPDTLHCPSHTPWENPYHYLRRHSKHIG